MKQRLYQKLQKSEPYTREELLWFLENIGHPEAEIRDDLVYASFCHALLDGLVSKSDFRWLADQVTQRHLLFFHMDKTGLATLTRSFTALLMALLIGLDGDKQSAYCDALSIEQRQDFFRQSTDYLKEETDNTGWSDDYGWVHAFAHGAEFLLYASHHPDFSESYEEVWEVTTSILKKQPAIFTANEEKRLATVISQLILQEKITQQDLLIWLSKTNFPDTKAKDYLRWINYQNFLMTIYLDLNQGHILEQNLKEKIQKICSL